MYAEDEVEEMMVFVLASASVQVPFWVQVIVALGLVAGALAAFFSFLAERKKFQSETQKARDLKGRLHRAEAKLEECKDSLHALKEELKSAATRGEDSIERYGLRAREIEVQHVIDRGGNSTTRKSYRGVECLGGVQHRYIKVASWHGTPGAEHDGDPQLVRIDGDDHGLSRDPEWSTIQSGGRHRISLVKFEPPFSETDGPITFEVNQRIQGVCLLTAEEVAEAYRNDFFKREYCSLRPEYQVDRIVLRVTFFPGYPAKYYARVFLWESEAPHEEESRNIADCLERRGDGATLRVENPMVGLRYCIYWKSPTAAELASLTGEGGSE